MSPLNPSSKMKLVLVLTLACAALAAPSYEPIALNYHETVGIPEAARIKAAETARDFDGGRIVGGTHSQLGQFPHLGGLLITLFSGATSVCGSSLLSNTRVVTAAHCWFDGQNNAREVTVVLGSVWLFFGGLRVTSSQVDTHALYSPTTLNNDIAIIRVNHITFTQNIQPIQIATGLDSYVGLYAVAAGFGRTADGAAISQNQALSHVSMRVITNVECQGVFGSAVVVPSVICTSTAGGRSICSGDSGGPLEVGKNLIGLSTFVARAGCSVGLPAGFVRVTSFTSWIRARL